MSNLQSRWNCGFWLLLMSLVYAVQTLADEGSALLEPDSVSLAIPLVEILSDREVVAYSDDPDWEIGRVYPVTSQDEQTLVKAFIELVAIEDQDLGRSALYFELQRHLNQGILREGDLIQRLDFSTGSDKYRGSTELLIRQAKQPTSARYRPLYTMGVDVGDTAQTLDQGEKLVNLLGYVHYGLYDSWSLSTWLPLNLMGYPNLTSKVRILNTENHTLSVGSFATYSPSSGEIVLSGILYWDSMSGGSQVTHTALSASLITFEEFRETAGVGLLASTTLKTSYEFILSNWDRFIVGPSYDFNARAVGGYIGYIAVWDHFHLSLSLHTRNVGIFELDRERGYYPSFDAYWRF